MKVKKSRKWRNYNKEDYRVEQYCKFECPYCRIKEDNGQTFCWGKFERLEDGKIFIGNGAECTITIKVCFDERFKLIGRC